MAQDKRIGKQIGLLLLAAALFAAFHLSLYLLLTGPG